MRYNHCAEYCYVYVLRSQADHQFYVGLTRDLPARLRAHNDGRVNSTKKRRPFELVYWKGAETRATLHNERTI
ncbi:MAG: GIY-YIG nuclease family protein [Candidatus Udaeobacter sp.]